MWQPLRRFACMQVRWPCALAECVITQQRGFKSPRLECGAFRNTASPKRFQSTIPYE